MSRNLHMFAAALFIALATLAMCVFSVDQRYYAIVFQLGEVVEVISEPGLHWKWPLINNVRKFDRRLQTLDTDPERFLTAEKKNVIVDSFVKWRIADTARFYTAVAGDPLQANLRLDQITKDSMRSEFSKRTVQDVVAGDRRQIMDILSTTLRREAANLGVEVVDVRIKRIDLPQDVSSSVFRRMRAERERVARHFEKQLRPLTNRRASISARLG